MAADEWLNERRRPQWVAVRRAEPRLRWGASCG
jgi:hypothetical protein